MLRPFVHYVPFSVKVPKPNYGHRDPARRQPRLDGVETNLSQVIQAAREDDEGSRRIAEQAHHFAHTHLCDAARHCYLYELLKRLSYMHMFFVIFAASSAPACSPHTPTRCATACTMR